MESIFSFIKSYVPTSSRDPQEDYLTQLFAWMLSNVPNLGVRYCQFLLSKIHDATFTVDAEDNVEVRTQVAVEFGRVDLVLGVGQNHFLCEHKVGSGLGVEQIERYTKSFRARGGHFYTVLVTATRLQHTQNADLQLVWADVYDFLISEKDNYDNAYSFLLEQLIQFLKQQGLARMEPLSMENILGYFPGQELQGKLEHLFSQMQYCDWETMCPNLKSIKPQNFEPTFKKLRWGRIGIDFFRGMLPGLFAGVLVDDFDNKAIEFIDKRLGPDLVVFFEYDYYPNPASDAKRIVMENRDTLTNHPSYKNLCSYLSENRGDFKFFQIPSKSRWRILVLQMPLIKVLYGASTEQEQIQRIFQALAHGINLITHDGLLASIELKDVGWD